MMRLVVFDVETTGLKPEDGDRVFEIGCVEIVDKKITERTFQVYINPERKLSKESIEICKIDPSILTNKPKFKDVVEGFINFINFNKEGNKDKAALVAHNIKFDVSFMNMELERIGMQNLDSFERIDTAKMAKTIFPGKPTNLDSLCKNFGIDLSVRNEKGHGALLDSELLAEIFLLMTKDKPDDFAINIKNRSIDFVAFPKQPKKLTARMFKTESTEEISKHNDMLEKIKAKQW